MGKREECHRGNKQLNLKRIDQIVSRFGFISIMAF